MSRTETKSAPRGAVHRLAAVLVLVGMGFGLSGCIVAPGRPGWCYWHPLRCR